MTRMTKSETELLAQAAAVVDTLLPKFKVPEKIESEHTLLDAAAMYVDLGKNETPGMAILSKVQNQINAYNEWMLYGIAGKKSITKKWFEEHYENSIKPNFWTGEWHEDIYSRRANPIDDNFLLRCQTIFLKAFLIVKDEKFWCQGHMAKPVRIARPATIAYSPTVGSYTAVEYEEVQQVCSLGAILKADGTLGNGNDMKSHASSHSDYVIRKLAKAMGRDVHEFNDGNSHQAVVAAWERCGRENNWL